LPKTHLIDLQIELPDRLIPPGRATLTAACPITSFGLRPIHGFLFRDASGAEYNSIPELVLTMVQQKLAGLLFSAASGEQMKLILVACLIPLIAWTAETEESPRGWREWVMAGRALTRTGNYAAAAQAFRRALAAAEGTDVGKGRLAELYHALASAYAEAGQYSESEHEYRRALALAERTEGRQSLEYALLVAGMAVLPTQIGSREPMIKILREAIAANRRTSSARERAMLGGCLARMLLDGERYVEAESVLLEAQSGAAGLKTGDPILLADLLSDLGVLRFDQRRYSESVDLYLESVRLFERAIGDQHPLLVAPLNNLGLSYLKLGRLNDAELTLRRANDVCDNTLGVDHATCGVVLEGYAVVLRKLNRKREAKALAARSQRIAHASQRRNGVGSTISVTALRTKSNNVR
jgi:tetratricopeptide (TPR) repeat protein